VAEWNERSVGFEDEGRDRIRERTRCGVGSARRRKKRGGIFRQEIAIEKIEMNDDPVRSFGLEAGGFDEGNGQLMIVGRCIAERFCSPAHDFERMDLEEPGSLGLGEICNPLQFVTIELRERKDEPECNPGLAQKREPLLHRFERARGTAHAIVGFRRPIKTDRDETVARAAQPIDSTFIQQHSVRGDRHSHSELSGGSQQFTQRLVKERLAAGEADDIVPIRRSGGDRLPDNLWRQLFRPRRR